ncbi:MAG TPA: hypothetical protein VGQ57_08440 [Polyangiaceae bacterium]|jgi:hypothetical protein|nr:hypothetical protein [Polyangiaceae bacterium]
MIPLRHRVVLLALAVAVVGHAPTLHAEEAPTLARAEAAYLEVDFESTERLSAGALEAGGNEPADTLRLYTLLGISASALGDETAARDAFRHVVALDPNGHLDKSLSPKVRAPYLEVRGQLSARGEIAALEAHLAREGGTQRIALTDPAGIGHGIDVLYRSKAEAEFATLRLAPGKLELPATTAAGPRLEYALAVYDEHKNVLYRRGSEQAPATLALVEPGLATPRAEPGPTTSGYYVAAGILAGAGLAAAGVGVYFTAQREEAAHEWNGASCEKPGSTRGQQCADVNARRETAEHLAIGFYAGAGALVVGSVVTLLLAPSSSARSRRAALPCLPGVAPLGAACSLSF